MIFLQNGRREGLSMEFFLETIFEDAMLKINGKKEGERTFKHFKGSRTAEYTCEWH
jgi:hypothetical protein